jgi:predicted CXXCH cytochrome family protein
MKAKTMPSLIIRTIVLLSVGVSVHAQEKVAESCITAKCHVTLGKAKFVHGPVAVAACAPCHELLPGEKHKFKPIQNAEALCIKCHEPMKKKAVVHAPVAKGQCTLCHDAHQSNYQYQLKKGPVAELCFSCHDRAMMKKKYAHSPAGEGDCGACHRPHSADKPKLLVQSGNDLCFECHSNVKDDLASAKKIHKPVVEGCVQCHSPHSNDGPFMLSKEVPDQCLNCHKDMREHLSKALVKHKALDMDKKCVNCHSPHGAQFVMQLVDEPMRLCLRCHDRAIQTQSSGTLADMKDLFAKNKDWHGPIREKDCSGCHDVHGSANFRILRQSYPQEFYTSFSQEQFELCFACHQPSLVQDPATTTLTGFRDGDRNLHYLHVNKKVKGRTCRACHETHASQKSRHIREAVPFGQWMLPIRFERSSNGGKCTPGCHAPKEYSRTSISVGNKKEK